MENKHVGFLILGIAAVLVVIIFLFQNALIQIINASCTMDNPTCPMIKTTLQQTYLSLAIVCILVIIAVILIFTKPKEKIIIKTKTVKEKPKKIDTSKLEKDEEKVVEILQKENGGMFQADMMEKLEIGKVGMTRLLDKLEAKQIVERKRRGMNNMVVLKD